MFFDPMGALPIKGSQTPRNLAIKSSKRVLELSGTDGDLVILAGVTDFASVNIVIA